MYLSGWARILARNASRSAAVEAGRDPATLILSAAQVVCVGADPGEFERRAAAIGQPPDVLRAGGVGGLPDEVTDKLLELKREVGGFGGLLVIGHEWQPREPWLNSMTLLHDRVLPQL